MSTDNDEAQPPKDYNPFPLHRLIAANERTKALTRVRSHPQELVSSMAGFGYVPLSVALQKGGISEDFVEEVCRIHYSWARRKGANFVGNGGAASSGTWRGLSGGEDTVQSRDMLLCPDLSGNLPLHFSCYTKSNTLGTIRCLVRCCPISMLIRNVAGLTALDVARQCNANAGVDDGSQIYVNFSFNFGKPQSQGVAQFGSEYQNYYVRSLVFEYHYIVQQYLSIQLRVQVKLCCSYVKRFEKYRRFNNRLVERVRNCGGDSYAFGSSGEMKSIGKTRGDWEGSKFGLDHDDNLDGYRKSKNSDMDTDVKDEEEKEKPKLSLNDLSDQEFAYCILNESINVRMWGFAEEILSFVGVTSELNVGFGVSGSEKDGSNNRNSSGSGGTQQVLGCKCYTCKNHGDIDVTNKPEAMYVNGKLNELYEERDKTEKEISVRHPSDSQFVGHFRDTAYDTSDSERSDNADMFKFTDNNNSDSNNSDSNNSDGIYSR